MNKIIDICKSEEYIDIKIGLIGLGGVGKTVLSLLNYFPKYELVEAYSVSGRYDGANINDIYKTSYSDLLVKNFGNFTNNNSVDVFIHATRSFPEVIIPELEKVIKSGSNIISTSEYLSCLKVNYPKEFISLNNLAIENNVSVVGLGVNPGYVFDYLPLTLAISKAGIKNINIKRIVDGSVFGELVWDSLGLNISEDEFISKTSKGEIKAHIGFKESATMIIEGLGDSLDFFEESMIPIISNGTKGYRIKKGLVAGFTHTAKAESTNNILLDFELILHTNLVETSLQPVDEIFIDGSSSLSATFSPGFNAHETTASNILNNVPLINKFKPGLWRVTDLQPSKILNK